jgi:hypothetical protein
VGVSGLNAPEGFATWPKEQQDAYLVKLGVKPDPAAAMTPQGHSEHMSREAQRFIAAAERGRAEEQRRRGIAP